MDRRKGKERKSIYIAPFIYYVYLKALRHGSHSFTYKYIMPEIRDTQLQLTTHLSTPKGKAELAWLVDL